MPSEFECGAPDCTFLIRTEDEIVEHVRMHAAEKHDREVDEELVRDRDRPIVRSRLFGLAGPPGVDRGDRTVALPTDHQIRPTLGRWSAVDREIPANTPKEPRAGL